MSRLTLVVVAWMSLASLASASLTPRKEPSPFGKEVPRVEASRVLTEVQQQPAVSQSRPEFVVTDQTEILLNGQPCRYADVPPHASILRMEVAEDKKTVLKIHFRSRK